MNSKSKKYIKTPGFFGTNNPLVRPNFPCKLGRPWGGALDVHEKNVFLLKQIKRLIMASHPYCKSQGVLHIVKKWMSPIASTLQIPLKLTTFFSTNLKKIEIKGRLMILLMVQKSQIQPPGRWIPPVVNK